MGTHFRGSPRQVQALDAYIKLVRAAESVTAALQPGLAAWGLTTSQFGALEALWHLGPMCQRELGEKLLNAARQHYRPAIARLAVSIFSPLRAVRVWRLGRFPILTGPVRSSAHAHDVKIDGRSRAS